MRIRSKNHSSASLERDAALERLSVVARRSRDEVSHYRAIETFDSSGVTRPRRVFWTPSEIMTDAADG